MLILLTAAAIITACKDADQDPTEERKLSISRLGFVADWEHPVTPGSEVEVFAYANKKKGVDYEWETQGEWKETGSPET